jgi:hypothetical protein
VGGPGKAGLGAEFAKEWGWGTFATVPELSQSSGMDQAPPDQDNGVSMGLAVAVIRGNGTSPRQCDI